MKNGNKLAIVTVTAIAAMFVSQARAQSLAVGDDGIAASPKVRQMLNDRKAATKVLHADTTVIVASAGGIAASPKVRQMLNERKAAVGSVGTAEVYAGYRATGVDGITASPKARAQLEERGSQFQIAPVK